MIKVTAKFFGKEFTQEQIDVLCDHLSFNSMKNNPAVNYEAVVEVNRIFDLIPANGEFMRKGFGLPISFFKVIFKRHAYNG